MQRFDIQGLRALAVILVIADHLLAWPSGGFVGVDVFFVISGFVITASLVREHERRGRISFANFYRRRARRILPLASLVIVVTLIAAWVTFSTARLVGIAQDGLWSLLSVANWHLALAGTNYMQADGVVSPLQHFWSLAVEEQFYFAWPWLIVLVLGVAAGRRHLSATAARGYLAGAMVALIAATFCFAMWETATSPTVAYFSTFSRAWELGIGGLLAVLVPAMTKIPNAIRPLLAYLGLAGILGGAFYINPQMPFPGPWAAVPVLATAVVIAAGSGGEQRYLQPLTNRTSRYLGDISYSLYLWHFPVVIVLEALLPASGPLQYGIALALTLALSAWSYSFVEQPVRHSNWLEPKAHRKPQHEASRKLAVGALMALGLITAIVVSFAVVRAEPKQVAFVPPVPTASATPGTVSTTPEQTKINAKITAALSTSEWPELSPSIDTLSVESKAPEWVKDGCLGDERGAKGTPAENAQRCVYGDPKAAKTAVILGDSIGISWAPAIRAALEPQGYKIIVYTLQQCPSVDIQVLKGDKSAHPMCAPFREWTFDQVRNIRPDLVITSNAPGTFDRLSSGASGVPAMAEWTSGTTALAKAVGASAKQVLILDPPPGGKSFADCATRLSQPAACATTVNQRFRDMSQATRAGISAAGVTNVRAIETSAWFCAGSDCPAFAGTTPIYADGAHLTAAYSSSLGAVMTEVLAAK